MWCIGAITGEYLACMEDVLDLYDSDCEPGVRRMCFDERPCQLIGDVLSPIPAKPGSTKKEHQEYMRGGTCNVLLAYDIDRGQRYLMVSKTKNRADYATFMKWLIQEHCPEAEKIKLIQDNFATHSYGAFYDSLPAEQARQMRKKLEFHFTPKHASWLNMAEIEFSALSRQCLDRRIGTMEELEREASIWQSQRNQMATKINWSFTTEKARAKLGRWYKEISTQN